MHPFHKAEIQRSRERIRKCIEMIRILQDERLLAPPGIENPWAGREEIIAKFETLDKAGRKGDKRITRCLTGILACDAFYQVK